MYKIIRPLLFTQDSEDMHLLALWIGEKILSRPPFRQFAEMIFEFKHPALEQDFLGLHFKNPIGVPGGFDKNARLLDFWPALGLGFVEIGSVTAKGGEGNPRPRIWRLPEDRAVIQHVGLPNIGADKMEEKLAARTPPCAIPLGINITKTHDPNILGEKGVEDFCHSFKKLHRFADYVLLNVSCPNTAEGKTFEECTALEALLKEIKKIADSEKIAKPILLKFSPDLSFGELDKILEVAERYGILGYILSNSSHGMREGLKTSKLVLDKIGPGGLSGEPIRQKTTELIRHVYGILKRPCVIGLGGVSSAEHAYEKIRAGASLVQTLSGLIYEGPGVVKHIKRGLVRLLERDGFKNIAEAVGADVK